MNKNKKTRQDDMNRFNIAKRLLAVLSNKVYLSFPVSYIKHTFDSLDENYSRTDRFDEDECLTPFY